jgi:O-antigen/teichoic acid export membrane protein
MRNTDSFKKRYFIKFLKSISDALVNVFLLLFVPRVLGPANYGSFSFIRDTFQSIITFSDLNLNSAHINYAARKQNMGIASNVYFTYTLLVGILILLFVFFITQTGIDQYLFPKQSVEYLFLGSILAYLMYLSTGLMGLSDSKVATVGFEIRSIIINISMFCMLVILYFTQLLNLETYFLQRILLYLLLLIFGYLYLSRSINFRFRFVNPRDKEVKEIIRDFFIFSYPLFTLSIVGILFGFFDRWFLQIIYGSVSQGFFTLAFSLSSIASLFLSPMTPLLMQSIAKADEENNSLGMKNAFDKVKFLYLIGAFLSIFFMFHTKEIMGLIGGSNYQAATSTVVVMFIYPIHVVYGQFCGGVLIALRKTQLYRNISIVSTIVGVIITYVLLAPKSFFIPGLELNSFGLALKLVLIQLFSVMTQLYFVCKYFNVKISGYLISQIIIPIPILVVGFLEWFIRNSFSFNAQGPIENILILAGAITFWFLVLGTILWLFPNLGGFDKEFLKSNIQQVTTLIRRKVS